MENPATWGPAERIVQQVISEWHENQAKPPEERRYGLSLARLITDGLREAELLRE